MAATPSMVFKFTVPYKGGTKPWSFRMHFNGGLPSGDSPWHTFFEAVWADLKAGIRADVELTAFVGYGATGPAVYTEPISGTVGDLPITTGQTQDAIVCALLSWTTDARNTRGGPIYLRNFIHGAALNADSPGSPIHSTQAAALQTVAAKFDDAGAGYSDGTNTYKRAGPNGVAGLVGTCETYPSRRVLARRG